jgi:hypothetical protein
VVTKDIEPYTVVGGNPTKPIKQRFSEGIIAGLCETRWWDRGGATISDSLVLIAEIAEKRNR